MNIMNFFKRNKKPAPAQKRGFTAAKMTDLTAGWGTTTVSLDSELRGDLRSLRARSRNLAQNDPYFKRFLQLARQNVVGSNGIRLKSDVQEETKDGIKRDEAAIKTIQAAWNDWGRAENCTVRKNVTWRMFQEVALQQAMRDGEVFIRKIRNYKGNDYKFALEVINADNLDEGFEKRLSNGNYIKMGIEFDKWSTPIAYHFWKNPPNEYTITTHQRNERICVPAKDVIHLFMPEDLSQSRGFPWGVTSMLRTQKLNGYEDAEVSAAQAAARHMGFFMSADGESYNGDGNGTSASGKERPVSEMEGLEYEQLAHGIEYKSANKEHPTGAYEAFIKGVLRGIASGLGIGYNTLANDYEGVNFSSLRQSNLTERDCWRSVQKWLIETLHEEVFTDWLWMALATRKVALPLDKFDKFKAAKWQPRGWQWVDPLKEINANKEAINNNLTSATEVAAQQGYDLESIYKDIADEKKLRAKYGIAEVVEAAPAAQPLPEGDADDDAADNKQKPKKD